MPGPLRDAVSITGAVAAPIVVLEVGLRRRARPLVSNVTWAALDDPSSSWWPVTVWAALSAHLLARARWPHSLALGAAAGALTALLHRTVDTLRPGVP